MIQTSFAGDQGLTKSELIKALSHKLGHLEHKDIELSVKILLELMVQSLSHGKRIEIRGFGSFSLHYRPARIGRNPKTGESLMLSEKYVPHFKPGRKLRQLVDEGMHHERLAKNKAAIS